MKVMAKLGKVADNQQVVTAVVATKKDEHNYCFQQHFPSHHCC
jgi:hypothetical protein